MIALFFSGKEMEDVKSLHMTDWNGKEVCYSSFIGNLY